MALYLTIEDIAVATSGQEAFAKEYKPGRPPTILEFFAAKDVDVRLLVNKPGLCHRKTIINILPSKVR